MIKEDNGAMQRQKRLIILMVFLALNGLVHCGGAGGDNAKVDFEITPKNPIVILADLILNPGDDDEVRIMAPWFKYGVKVYNGSDKTITIQSLVLKFTATGKNGELLSGNGSLDPGTEDKTYIAVIPPKSAYVSSTDWPDGLYAHSLPKDAAGNAYSVEVEVQGWFGTSTEPLKRLEKSYSFATR
jgi:hypothetical protein